MTEIVTIKLFKKRKQSKGLTINNYLNKLYYFNLF